MSEPKTRYEVGRQDDGERLDRFLHERIPRLSRTRIQRAIRERVTLSWTEEVRPSTPVRAGGTVTVGYRAPVETVRDVPLPVLDRGRGWLAVDKPPGLVVHPVNGVLENSLIRMLRRQEGQADLRLVHRLDAETSGVLLVAGDPETARALSLAFARGRVEKRYMALVAGRPTEDRGAIDRPVGRDAGSPVFVKQAAGVGSRAVTEWEVLRRFDDRTLLDVRPRTGRRHQIRVHLASIGHPILGDLLYGRGEKGYLDRLAGAGDPRSATDGPRRHLLHCAELAFPEPATGQARAVRAELPEDMLRHLRGAADRPSAPAAPGRPRTGKCVDIPEHPSY